MSAKDILDAIARKHSSCALITEVVVTDPHEEQLSAEWWARHRADNFASNAADPYPKLTWQRRIDGLLLDGGGLRTAIEVKISRSDFFRETDAKRRVWRSITDRFVYATPPGLLKPEEIPDGCGLWEVDETVTVVKRAKRNPDPHPIPHQVLVALAYRLSKRAETVTPLGAAL